MDTSKASPELFTAIADAQGEIENADKNSENPHFHSRYANLAEVLNTIRPVFSRHGLSIVQSPSFDGNKASVTTLVAHKTGGYIIDTASCVPKKSDGQGIGDATTYLRRYAAAAFAGIAQEDDDGEAAKHEFAPDGRASVDGLPPGPRPAQPRPAKQSGSAHLSGKTRIDGVFLMDSEEKGGTSKTTGKPWTLWKFTLSSPNDAKWTGVEVSTFWKDVATQALRYVDDQGRHTVDIEVQPGKKEGTIELISVTAADDIPT